MRHATNDNTKKTMAYTETVYDRNYARRVRGMSGQREIMKTDTAIV
jgi:hypothetical protein